MLDANGQTAADILEKITSRGSNLHPAAAPAGEGYALPGEKRARTHRIPHLLIERTIPAICNGFRRFCYIIAPSRRRITRIQCRQVGISSATDKEACNRNERASNQAALYQSTPCNHSMHVHTPLGNNKAKNKRAPCRTLMSVRCQTYALRLTVWKVQAENYFDRPSAFRADLTAGRDCRSARKRFRFGQLPRSIAT